VIKKNGSDREEAMNAPVDGYELFMQFIVQQYRRGLRHQVGIPDEDSDTTDEGQEQEGEDAEQTDSDSDSDRPRRVRCVPS